MVVYDSVGRSSQVGVPRHTTPNGAAKPFLVGCAQIRKLYKSPRSLFSTGFAGFCMRGGQMVVTLQKRNMAVVKLERWQYALTYI